MSSPRAEIPADALPPGAILRVEVAGEPVCVANVEGTVHAVSDTCTHAHISLSGGGLAGRQIVCPRHGAMFDLKTGRATCGPAVDPLRVYAVRRAEEVFIVEPAPEE